MEANTEPACASASPSQAAPICVDSDSDAPEVIPDTDDVDAHCVLQISASVRHAPVLAEELHVASRGELAVHAATAPVQVISVSGVLSLFLDQQATYADATEQLVDLGCAGDAGDLVRLCPAPSDGPTLLVRHPMQGVLTVAIRRRALDPYHLVACPVGGQGCDLQRIWGHSDSLHYCGQPATRLQTLFSGMVFDVVGSPDEDGLETTPVTRANLLCQGGARPSHASHLPVEERTLPQQCAGSPDARLLELDSLVHTHLARPHNVGVCFDMIAHWTEVFRLDCLVQEVPCHMSLPLSSRSLVANLPSWRTSDRPSRLLLYTDGSFCHRRHKSSWAVAVFADDGDHAWCWAGYAASSVPCEGSYAAPSAFEAELFALAATFCAVLRSQPACATCAYDSQSAAAVAHCVASTAFPHPLAASVRSLYLACVAAGIELRFMHTYSHRGDPGNKLADALKEHCNRDRCEVPSPWDLQQTCSWPEIHRLWMAVRVRDDLPPLHYDGQTPALHVAVPCRASLTTPSGLAGLPVARAARTYRLALRLATYNTLSLRSHLQQQALARLFHQDERHVIGLQETRLPTDNLAQYGAYTAFCSPADNGTEGVHLWIDFTRPVTLPDSRNELRFRRDTFCVRHKEPRLLLVTGCLGDIRLLFVVGHALTSTQPDDAIEQWWAHLDAQVRRMPRGFCPIFLLDANARFRPAQLSSTASAGEPENCNAAAFLATAESHSLHLSGLRDQDGEDIVSWVSPSGHKACIDFVAVPDSWSSKMCRGSAPARFCDQFAGIDHHPVYVDLDLSLESRANLCSRLPPARALCSPEGHARLHAIWQSMPQVPWHVDVDSHLAVINTHLRQGVLERFDAPARASHPAISEASWNMLREQRQLRRLLSRLRAYSGRDTLSFVFRIWRSTFAERDVELYFARQHRTRMHMATVAKTLQFCRKRLRQQSQLDRADFTRDMFRAARTREDLPHLLRSILRTGRRYKAPALVPDMEIEPGVSCGTRDEFLAHAGRHFARAERATPTTLAQLPAVYPGHRSRDLLQLEDLPTLEDLTSAFSRLKCGRAPGLTGLLPEVYKGCPALAALAHWPLAFVAGCCRASSSKLQMAWRVPVGVFL